MNKIKKYHWDFILSCLFSLYLTIYSVCFLYRVSIYYNYILILLLGIFLGFKLGRKLFENKEM